MCRAAIVALGALACACGGAPGTAPESQFAKDSGFDYALSFDGVSDYATAGTAQLPFSLAPQTISLWFRASDVQAQQAFVTLRKDFQSGVELGLRDGSLAAWRVYGSTPDLIATSVSAGAWHHAAYGYDGITSTLYLDGAPVTPIATTTENRTPTSFWLGTLDGTRDFYSGLLDDVRVWSVLRTPQQVVAEARGTFSSDESGLVADFTFDESGGPHVYDRSGVGNDATLGDGVPANMPTRVLSDKPYSGGQN